MKLNLIKVGVSLLDEVGFVVRTTIYVYYSVVLMLEYLP